MNCLAILVTIKLTIDESALEVKIGNLLAEIPIRKGIGRRCSDSGKYPLRCLTKSCGVLSEGKTSMNLRIFDFKNSSFKHHSRTCDSHHLERIKDSVSVLILA